VRASLAALVIFGAAMLGSISEPATADEGLFERDRLTGDWGGARTALGQRGVDITIKAGDALVLSGTDTLSATVEPATVDEFVRWCRAHDYHEDRLAAPHHVSPAMTGFEELDSYGIWAREADYGEVWFPKSVPADWAPYREGRWVWIEPWGWNWVDDEPWGFAPCHYGRWARIHDRWAWVPGEFAPEPVYAPALVAFIPPPAIEVAGTDTRISASKPFIGLSSPVSSASGPSNEV